MATSNQPRYLGKQLTSLSSQNASGLCRVWRNAGRFAISLSAKPCILLRERLVQWDLFFGRAVSLFMRKDNSRGRKTVISLAPLNSGTNKYVDLFSKAIS